MELIRIDFEKGELKTPGHTYYINETCSMDRMIKFEELQCGLAYGHTFADIYTQTMRLKEFLQKAQFVDAAVIIGNLEQSLNPDNANAKKKHYALQICALFLNRPDEDIRTWNESVINEKIEDWLQAGVDFRDFFSLAVRSVPVLLEVLRETFLTISQMGEEIKKVKGTLETESST